MAHGATPQPEIARSRRRAMGNAANRSAFSMFKRPVRIPSPLPNLAEAVRYPRRFPAYRLAGASLVIARHRRSPAPDSQIQEAASAQRMSTTASQGGMSERSSVLATR